MATETTPKKRGRPPLAITSRDGTKRTLRELGITRKQASDWKAIASVPRDIFEKRLEDVRAGKRRETTQSLVRLACELAVTDRKAPMRDPSALEDARRALAKLTPDEALLLLRELFATPHQDAAGEKEGFTAMAATGALQPMKGKTR